MTATENKINHIVAITNSSFDVYKLDQWALEQYATGI